MSFILIDDGEISYHNPFGAEKTKELEQLLRSSGCFVTSFIGENLYSLDTYIAQYALHRTETVFLFDRNVYSDVLSLAKGQPVSESTKVSAGIMAFASCVNAGIEPVIALHEGAASGAKGGWKRDLWLFRASDKIHPVNWAMLALGHATRFDRKIVSERAQWEDASFNPKSKLRSMGFNYPALLKLAVLVRRGGDRNVAMMEFIDWMYFHWYFSAPATLFACIVLGKNPPANAFKGLHKTDRHQALRGVWNAAWDMVYVQEWFRRVKTQDEDNLIHVLCSRDVLLCGVAQLLRASMFEYESAGEPFVQSGFGKRVVKLYERRCSDLSSSDRGLKPMPEDVPKYRRRLLGQLRKEFLKPRMRS